MTSSSSFTSSTAPNRFGRDDPPVELDRAVGGCDHASMQVNFHDLSYEEAAISVRLFGEKVAPAFASTSG